MVVRFIKCDILKTPHGKLLKHIQKEHDCFNSFGESYFSWLNPENIMGWYRHKKYQSFMTSPTCNLHLAIFRENETFEFKLTNDNFGYIIIPPGYYYAMKSLDESPTLIANTLDHIYDSREVEKRDINNFERWFINA